MQILILANHSGGLYDFRKDLIAALKQHAEVSVAVPAMTGGMNCRRWLTV